MPTATGKKMPVSQAQNRWAHWAAKNESGSTQAAAEEFVRGIHGKTVKGLPKRVKPKPRTFGSIAP